MRKLIKKHFEDKFKRYLTIALLVIGFFLLVMGDGDTVKQNLDAELDIDFFFSPTCPHCHEQKKFNKVLMEEFPTINFIYHDVSVNYESELFMQYADKAGIAQTALGVPGTFFGDFHIIGFGSVETTGMEIRDAIIATLENRTVEKTEEESTEEKTLTLPFFGEINMMEYSLPLLAIILGFVDGFNPCAMWVLVYMISLIMTINDKRKIWLLVGSFLFASGVLYFLFMTAWLNVFLLVGYIRPLTIIIGLAALGIGIHDIRTFVKTKGALACDIGDMNSKKRTLGKIEKIVMSPLSLTTVAGIILLAFVVNSIEFACSSGIPAIFTQVLAVSALSWVQHYGYILLYVGFFMLDDVVIFSLAAFAASTALGDKYAKYCKLIGGAVLIILGLFLAFMPNALG